MELIFYAIGTAQSGRHYQQRRVFITVMVSTAFIVNSGIENFVSPVMGFLIGGIFSAPIGAIVAKYFLPRLMLILVGNVPTFSSAFAVLQEIFQLRLWFLLLCGPEGMYLYG